MGHEQTRQSEAQQEAQRNEPRGQNEGSTRQGGDIEEESTRHRTHGDAQAGGCRLLAELPTLRASGLGRNPIGENRRKDAGAGRDRTDHDQHQSEIRGSGLSFCHSYPFLI